MGTATLYTFDETYLAYKIVSIYALYTLALPKTFKLSGHRIIRSSPFTTKLLAKIGRDDLEKCKAGV